MAKNVGDDNDFIRELKEKRKNNPGTPMLLRQPPEGKGLSLEELVDNSNETQPVSENVFSSKQENGTLIDAPLDLLDDSPFQPRMAYDDQYIKELSGSFLEVGQTDVITVRAKKDRLEIIDGHCSKRAAQLAGWTSLRARLVEVNDRDAEMAALVQNDTRKGLTDYERACLYKRTMDQGYAGTQTQVARIFGRGQSRVSQVMTMLELPVSILQVLNKHPALFGYRTAKDIQDLLSLYPEEEALILQAIERLLHGASSTSIKGWVTQSLSKKRGRPTKPKTISVLDAQGITAFRAKVNSRQVIIDLVKPGIDPMEAQQWIVEVLSQRIVKSESN